MKRKNNYYTMMKRFPCKALITLALLTAYASGPKACCLQAPLAPADLVSPRIAFGERDIFNAVQAADHLIILIAANGFPDIYHPSTTRIAQCAEDRLLLVTPWYFEYRHEDDPITVPFCKTMNCLAQALCRRDDWWQHASSVPRTASSGSAAGNIPTASAAGRALL